MHIVWHPSSLEHDPGPEHPESPARLRAVLDELRRVQSTQLCWSEAVPATEAQLLRAHSASHLERLRQLAARGGGIIDADTTMSGRSYDAAVHAAGAAITVARLALNGEPAFAPVRPPGHHATATRAMGFCLLNSVAVAAYAALDEMGVSRVLIVDWDVHHGNGTQAIVERDPRIRYVSLHQWPLYPGTGREDERGVGNVFNVPRPPGLPRDRYVADLAEAVDRATAGWRPDLILVSAGFDALAGDPLAGFTLEPQDYAAWVERWKAYGVPIATVLEGGYVPQRIALAARRHVEALA
jgi:acetoin utilization deacetylase AcuC-like enzyme